MTQHRWTFRHPLSAALLIRVAPAVLVMVGLIVTLLVVTHRGPEPDRGLKRVACGPTLLRIIASGVPFCTHGGDTDAVTAQPQFMCLPLIGCPKPAPVPTPTPTPSPSQSPSKTPEPSPKPSSPSPPPTRCSKDSNAVQLVYGHPSDRADAFSSWYKPIRDIALRMDQALPYRNVKWVCASDGLPSVWRVTLPPVSNGMYTFNEYISGVRSAGGRAENRAYLGFVSGIEKEYPYGGQATLYEDDDPDPATNVNNTVGPKYSMVDHLSWLGGLHELGHNLGAVQCDAPHSTCSGAGSHHCWDENDVMCYADGTSHAMVRVCDVSTPLFDCRNDDYYRINPAAGSWFTKHWNLSRSTYLFPG